MMTLTLTDEAGRYRLSGVDVLRGLSVLLVTLHHIHLRFWINDYNVDGVLPKALNQVLFWSGYYAVITFFVISGFLIAGLSIRRWGQLGHIHIGRFYRMRAARILACLLVLGPLNRTAFADEDPWGQYAYLSCMDGIAFGCIAALASARMQLSR